MSKKTTLAQKKAFRALQEGFLRQQGIKNPTQEDLDGSLAPDYMTVVSETKNHYVVHYDESVNAHGFLNVIHKQSGAMETVELSHPL